MADEKSLDLRSKSALKALQTRSKNGGAGCVYGRAGPAIMRRNAVGIRRNPVGTRSECGRHDLRFFRSRVRRSIDFTRSCVTASQNHRTNKQLLARFSHSQKTAANG